MKRREESLVKRGEKESIASKRGKRSEKYIKRGRNII